MSGKAPIKNPYARKKSNSSHNKADIKPQQKEDSGRKYPTVRKRKNSLTKSSEEATTRASNSSSTFSQAFDRSELSPLKKSGERIPCTEQIFSDDNYPPVNVDVPLTSNAVTREQLSLAQPHVLHVSHKQRGNGLLRYLRNVPYAFSNMTGPDYIISPNQCALYLSMKYHNLHPNYIHRRIAEIKNDFDLRVLLCLVDVCDNAATLLFLNKLCAVNNLTLLLAWSEEEAGKEAPVAACIF